MHTTPESSGASPRLRFVPDQILLFRPLQLGDLLVAVPAFRAIRHAYPAAAITLCGLPWAREFAARFAAYFDDFIEFPGYPGLPEREYSRSAYSAFLETVQARHFALAVQAHGSGEVTNPLVLSFVAEMTAGFYAPGSLFATMPGFIPHPSCFSERDRLLSLAQSLGADTSNRALEFPVFESDDQALADLLEHANVSGPYAVVHPGSRDAARRWAPASFARVADALSAAGLRVILTGTESERPILREVESGMARTVINLCGRTSLGSLAALIRNAAVLVSNDTGAAHLADALGTPSVVVFSGSDPDRWAAEDRQLHRVVDSRARAAQPDEVIAHALELAQAEAMHYAAV